MTLATTILCVFWLGALGLVYVFCGYPVLLFVLSRFSKKRFILKQPSMPAVSVILAAHNEQERICARLQNLLSSDYPAEKIEVIVVSDGSNDSTVAHAESFPDSRVRVIAQQRRAGKAYCLNAGVSLATGEIIVFADVRQRFARDTIKKLTAHFSDGSVGAVSGALEIEPSRTGVGAGVDAYWRLEKFIRHAEAQIDSAIGCTGAVYAIRRDMFESIPSDTILDDVVIPMRVALKGCRVLFDSSAIAYDPQTLEPEREKVRKQRTLAGNFQMLFRYPEWLLPWRNRLWWQLISHKYLRLAAPFFMMNVFVSNALLVSNPFFKVTFAAQCAFYFLAFAGMLNSRSSLRFLSIPAGFVFLNFMTLCGLYHYLRGSYRGGRWPISPSRPVSVS